MQGDGFTLTPFNGSRVITHVPKKFPIMMVFATARNLSIGVILVSWVVSFFAYWEHTHAFTCCSLSLRSSSSSLKNFRQKDHARPKLRSIHNFCNFTPTLKQLNHNFRAKIPEHSPRLFIANHYPPSLPPLKMK